jgi:hypothetical protein
MKSLFAAIFLATTLGSAPVVEEPVHHHQHAHHGYVHQIDGDHLARATMFKAVCSKGDLNATYKNRSAAVKAAQKHQQATGHKTSVRKQ